MSMDLRTAIADALDDHQTEIADIIAPTVARYTAPDPATADGMAVHPVRALPDFEERMAAARARSEWELGDPSWADKIVGAFADPAVDRSELEREQRSE